MNEKNTDSSEMMTQAIEFFKELQGSIISDLERLENRGGGSQKFLRDEWNYDSGGGGLTCVMMDGQVFEKAGVNFSNVRGEFSEQFASTMPGEGREFEAVGVSLVIHPRSPHVPTVHANFRHIRKGAGSTAMTWFGGGADLTPYYLCREDIIHFHKAWKEVCQRHVVADYERYKEWCDEYFFLPHRKEARGVGGIFFDHVTDDIQAVFEFVQDAGNQFVHAYRPIVERRMHDTYTAQQRRWQLIRRGRYVEFNLLHDRGTKFGLQTGGRTESILMSLPLNAMWSYQEVPEPGSSEAELLESLKPRDWASE